MVDIDINFSAFQKVTEKFLVVKGSEVIWQKK